MPSQLLFMNVPYNCSERELKNWIEAHSVETESVRIIRDLVAGVSPSFAYADLKDHTCIPQAVALLDGKKMGTHTITVKPAPVKPAIGGAAHAARAG
jgi:hypothetical protein